jgi:hypothetical protein
MRELLESTVWHIEIRPFDPNQPKSPKVSLLRCQVQAGHPHNVPRLMQEVLGVTARVIATDRDGAVYSVTAGVYSVEGVNGHRIEVRATGIGEPLLLHGPTPPEPPTLDELKAEYDTATARVHAAEGEFGLLNVQCEKALQKVELARAYRAVALDKLHKAPRPAPTATE